MIAGEGPRIMAAEVGSPMMLEGQDPYGKWRQNEVPSSRQFDRDWEGPFRMRIRSLFRVVPMCIPLIAACLTVTATPAANPDPSPIRKYDVVIRPSQTEVSLNGRERIEFDAATARGWPVRIPRNDLAIERILLDGRSIPTAQANEFIEIPRCKVAEIVYSARPKSGLRFAGQTLFSEFSTSHWMPCVEEPSVRARLTLRLVLPASLEAVATGRLVSRTRIPAQQAMAWRFDLDTPYPSYLYGFAAGPFVRTSVRHGAVELVAVSDGVSADRMRLLLEETGRMMDFFAECAGIAYPLPTYTQVLVSGDAAQEMAGLSVLGVDGLAEMLGPEPGRGAEPQAGPREDWLPAHELSHAWWGNLITCRNWDHFWLNEGFAVFMTAAWKERRWGAAGYQVEMDRARSRWKRAQDAGCNHPLAFGGEYPSMGLRNCIVYSKAAVFLDELRRTVGDGPFWRGLREYTRSQAGHSVVSEDFEKAMAQATKKDLGPLFQLWVDDHD